MHATAWQNRKDPIQYASYIFKKGEGWGGGERGQVH